MQHQHLVKVDRLSDTSRDVFLRIGLAVDDLWHQELM